MKNFALKSMLLAVLLLSVQLVCDAQKEKLDAYAMIEKNPYLALGNLYPYHPMDSIAVEAPRGYKLFHISHFGRHGSRYEVDGKTIDKVVGIFEGYHTGGILSQKGEQLYADLLDLRAKSEGNYGQLSTLGGLEHRQIARRMVRHYPQLFKSGHITCYTSNSKRVMDSRDNFLSVLREQCPAVKIDLHKSTDDKHSFQEIFGCNLSNEQWEQLKGRDSLKVFLDREWKEFDASHFEKTIFRQDSKIPHNVKGVLPDLWSAVKSSACIGAADFTQYFTIDELYHLWWRKNLNWYNSHSWSYDTKAIRPLTKGKSITEAIIRDADEVIQGKCHDIAILRFSHDGDLNALISYMNLEGVNALYYKDVENFGRDYENVLTAVNVQLLFFRNRKGDVLVRFLKNEMPVLLDAPLPTVYDGFYRWSDVKSYWTTR